MNNPNEHLRPDAVEKEYGCGLSEKRLRQLRWERVGPCYTKAGKSVFYRRSDIEAWLDSRRVDPAAVTAQSNDSAIDSHPMI